MRTKMNWSKKGGTGWDKDYWYGEILGKSRAPKFSAGPNPTTKRMEIGYLDPNGEKYQSLREFKFKTIEQGVEIVETQLGHLSPADLDAKFEEWRGR